LLNFTTRRTSLNLDLCSVDGGDISQGKITKAQQISRINAEAK